MKPQPQRQPGGMLSRLPATMPNAETLSFEAYEFVRIHFREDGRPYSATTQNHVLERVVAFLMQQSDISAGAAALIAGHAICEYLSTQARVSIDIDRSTAFGVTVTDQRTGTARLISAFEIGQLLDAQAILTASPAPH